MQKMDTYIKIISLIYNESQLEKPSDNKAFVNKILDSIKPPKKGLFGGVASIEDRLLDIINELLSMDYPISKEILLDSLNIGLRDDDTIRDLAINAIFKEYDTEKKRKRYIRDIKRVLNKRQNEYKFKNGVNKISMKMNMDANVSMDRVADELQECVKIVKSVDNGVMPRGFSKPLDIGNINDVSEAIADDVSMDGKNRFKLGYQSVNRMLNGGIMRGENVMLLFKDNGGKSSLAKTFMAQIAKYNKPINVHPDKKPLLGIITLEDSVLEVLTFMYKYLYVDKYGKVPVGKAKDETYLAEFMAEHLGVNGFHVQVVKGTATDSKIEDIEAVVDAWENQGYELHVLLVDYLAELSVADVEGYNSATKYKKLWSMFKKLGQNRNFTTISPHQASAEMMDILKDRSIRGIDVVKAMYQKNYIQHSKAINQVVDLTIIGYVAKYEGKKVLTLQRDRRRYNEIIDERDKYIVLPFVNDYIPSDIEKEDISIRVDSDYEEE